jgi:hypothetical protein
MANFINFENISYCGKEAQEIFSRDIYSMDLRNAGVTFMDGVKGKMKIYNGEIGDAWQLYTCSFSPAGAASLAEAYIQPSAIKVNQENCYDTFWNTFLVDQTEISLRGGIPQTFGDWYFGKLRQKMAREYQEIFWQGDTARTATTKVYLKAVDGVEKQLASNTGVTSGAVTAFTVDNILAQVEGAIKQALDLAAAGEYSTDNLKVLMNYADVQVLKMALGAICCPNNQSIFSNYAMGPDGGVIIFGIPVISTMQSRNTIIVGDPRNLVLGYDTFDSHLEYKLIDMRETTGDNAFRVLAISNIAVGIIFPESFVYIH